MGIRDWFSGTFGAKSYVAMIAPDTDGFMKSMVFGGDDLAKVYTQAIWTYICASRISQDIAALPVMVQRYDSKAREWKRANDIVDLNELIKAPYGPGADKPRLNWQQMIAIGQLRQELSGNQFYRISRAYNRVIGLGLILNTVKGVEDTSTGVPTRYKIGTAGAESSAQDMVNVMHANPASWWDGLSPAVAAEQAIHVDYSVSRRINYDLQKRVSPGLVFKVKALFSLNKTKRKETETWLEKQFGKASLQGKSMVVGDDVEIEDPPVHQVADLPTHHANARDAIISAYDVSPPVVGVLRDVKYQTWDQALRAQWALCVEPRAKNLYTTINSQAIWPVYGDDVRLWYDAIQTPLGLAAIRDRAETAKKYFDLGYPANAVNAHFGLGMPYFDELERPNMPSVIAGHEDETQPEPEPETEPDIEEEAEQDE